MMLDLDWNAAKNSLRESLPQTQYQNWLKPMELISCRDTSVVLGVPSQFHMDWIRNHYADTLQRVIHDQCGSKVQLEFEIRSQDSSSPEDEPLPTFSEPSLSQTFASAAPQTTRPSLRLVDSNPAPEVEPVVEIPIDEPEPSHIPSFKNPYFELEFNHMVSQCADLFALGSQEVEINPLIIYGGIGMGKTHLLAEIAQKIQRDQPGARVRYTSAELFAGEFFESLQAQRQNNSSAIMNFKRKYREHTDVLLFDDLDGLSNKKKTQMELVYIFNEIIARGGKIAFTTKVSPQRLEGFDETLRSRIVSGVIGEIKHPSFEERSALLQAVSLDYGLKIERPVLSSLAAQGQKDIRELVGTLVRAHLQAKLENRPLDHAFLTQEGFSSKVRGEAITIEEIISLVESNFGVSRSDLYSKSRKGGINWARQVTMYLARTYTLLPLEKIGKTFGRDHATVIHAHQKVLERMENSNARRLEVEFLKKKLQGRAPRED